MHMHVKASNASTAPGVEVRVGRQLDLAVLLGDAVDARARIAAIEVQDARRRSGKCHPPRK